MELNQLLIENPATNKPAVIALMSLNELSKYHLEAGIAYWHTQKEDTKEKWDEILQLYNHLLMIAYSPIVALNRTYTLAKIHGKQRAIYEAEKLNLTINHLYFSLLGNIYTDKGFAALSSCLELTISAENRSSIIKNIESLGIKTTPDL